MADEKEITPIAYIKSDFPSKFGVPRQSGLAEKLVSHIVFEKEYSIPEAFREIEGFTHLWLIWGFSKNEGQGWSPMVRPPRLGGEKRVGVFASRSPFRPNGLGLSCVKLLSVKREKEHTILVVCGGDLVDGTPIYDVKPYVPYSDKKVDAVGGFSEDVKDYRLEVEFPEELLDAFPQEKRDSLKEILSEDPRPAYHNDADRIYGMPFMNKDIKFTVDGNKIKVVAVVDYLGEK